MKAHHWWLILLASLCAIVLTFVVGLDHGASISTVLNWLEIGALSVAAVLFVLWLLHRYGEADIAIPGWNAWDDEEPPR